MTKRDVKGAGLKPALEPSTFDVQLLTVNCEL
jgi:hypothetical protein